MAEKETIAATATAPGKSALACIRVSGSRAAAVVAKCLGDPEKFKRSRPRIIRLYDFHSPKERRYIDEITAIRYEAPDSFTGENMVEIICHGGPQIIRKILESLYEAGAVPAGRGAFTRRALENGKIVLHKAEAIKGLIESANEPELLCAQKLYTGNNVVLGEWRKNLIELLAQLEAWIEFDEEELGSSDIRNNAKKTLCTFLESIKSDIKKWEKIKIFEKGIKIVIAGPVNAGKSTLFNEIVGYNRAIVHQEPGTTRDTVSENIFINGHEVLLIDSAGIRETDNEIEKEGIKRSREAITSAGILIWVTSAEETFQKGEIQELVTNNGKRVLAIINKSDLISTKEKEEDLKRAGISAIGASLKKRKNTGTIFKNIRSMVNSVYQTIEIPELFLNKRHETMGRKIFKEIKKADEEWESEDMAAEHIKKAIAYLDEIFGKTDSEEVLNAIFKHFCIGK